MQHRGELSVSQQQERNSPNAGQTDMFQSLLNTLKIVLRNAIVAALVRVLIGIGIGLYERRRAAKLFTGFGHQYLSIRNPLKWGALVGGFSAFRGIQQALLCVPYVPEQWTSFIAGAIAGLPIFIMNARTRTELTLYIGVRAIAQVLKMLLSVLPTQFQNFSHYSLVALTLSNMLTLYCYVFAPQALGASYNHLLDRTIGGKDPRVMRAVAAFQRRMRTPELVAYCLDHRIPVPVPEADLRPLCLIRHGPFGCTRHFFSFLLQHLCQCSLPLYIPYRSAMVILLSPKLCLRKPSEALLKMAKDSAASALSWSAFCAIPHAATCCFSHMQVAQPMTWTVTVGLLEIFSYLTEYSSRREDLALYYTMQALRAFFKLHEWQYAHFVLQPSHTAILFLFAVGVLCHRWDNAPDQLHVHFRTAFRYILNEKPMSGSVARSQGGRTSNATLLPPISEDD